MFYPILPSAYVFKEAPAREAYQLWYLSPSKRRLPTRWDHFLLGFGDLLIGLGKKVRNGSAYACCSEAKAMQVKPTGGSA